MVAPEPAKDKQQCLCGPPFERVAAGAGVGTSSEQRVPTPLEVAMEKLRTPVVANGDPTAVEAELDHLRAAGALHPIVLRRPPEKPPDAMASSSDCLKWQFVLQRTLPENTASRERRRT